MVKNPGAKDITACQDHELTGLHNQDIAVTEKFVRENIVWMLAVARRILRDKQRAEDAVQNAFVNIFNGLQSYEGRSTLKTWMHRIVVNQALTILRKEKRTRETSIDDLLPSFDDNDCRIEDRWTNFETPENLTQRSETRTAITERINQLPEQYRIILILRDIEELSTAEVAMELELSKSNVKVRLHRARSALKKLLEPLIRGESI